MVLHQVVELIVDDLIRAEELIALGDLLNQEVLVRAVTNHVGNRISEKHYSYKFKKLNNFQYSKPLMVKLERKTSNNETSFRNFFKFQKHP